MFSGLVESVQKIEKVIPQNQSLTLMIARPREFDDLKIGDSISVDGVCLTLEKFTLEQMQFTLGLETLHILFSQTLSDLSHLQNKLLGKSVNLERSLKWGDRVHGHMVSGHVEALGEVVRAEAVGDSYILEISFPSELKSFILKKGSIALHGVSLTVNEINNTQLQVCLIPETLRKTNLGFLRPKDKINIETDLNLKSIFKIFENEELLSKISKQLQLQAGGSL